MKPRHASKFEHHPAKDLKFDSEVQREVIPTRIRKLASSLDLDAIGVITVSRRVHRGKGSLYVLDGQHRILALMHHDLGDWPVKCHVYEGLTLADEAGLFRSLNDSRKVTAFDSFTKGVTAGDRECVAINGILEARGLTVSRTSCDGGVRAVAALQTAYRRQGSDALADALDVIVNAWGNGVDALDGNIIGGIALLTGTHNGALDRGVLVKKLAKFPGGPQALVGKAKGLREVQNNVSVSRAVAEVVRNTYNKGRRKDVLPA